MLFRSAWSGHPTTDPDVVVQQNDEGVEYVYVSWNGATEVAQWRLIAGPTEAEASEVTVVDKTGFETAIEFPDPANYVAVEALDVNGDVLGTGAPSR